jgi:20S proteasome alpha/beta subunit
MLLKQNSLYKKIQTRHLIEYNFHRLAKKDMTYILGARCTDGVVLVGDTKITIDEGADFAYQKKIKRIFPQGNVVMGASGMGGLYKDFTNRVFSTIVEMERQKEQYSPIVTEEQFELLVNKVIRGMHEDYGDDRQIILNNLMVICASRINGLTAALTVFTPYGFPEPVAKTRAIGHGEPYGALFLKKMWREKKTTMEDTAKLGLFILKMIQEMKLDNSVGFADECLPQVFYIPDVFLPNNADQYSQDELQELIKQKYPIKELEEDEVRQLINSVSHTISDLESLFVQGKLKL